MLHSLSHVDGNASLPGPSKLRLRLNIIRFTPLEAP